MGKERQDPSLFTENSARVIYLSRMIETWQVAQVIMGSKRIRKPLIYSKLEVGLKGRLKSFFVMASSGLWQKHTLSIWWQGARGRAWGSRNRLCY